MVEHTYILLYLYLRSVLLIKRRNIIILLYRSAVASLDTGRVTTVQHIVLLELV